MTYVTMFYEGFLPYVALDYGRAVRVRLPDGREVDIDMTDMTDMTDMEPGKEAGHEKTRREHE